MSIDMHRLRMLRIDRSKLSHITKDDAFKLASSLSIQNMFKVCGWLLEFVVFDIKCDAQELQDSLSDYYNLMEQMENIKNSMMFIVGRKIVCSVLGTDLPYTLFHRGTWKPTINGTNSGNLYYVERGPNSLVNITIDILNGKCIEISLFVGHNYCSLWVTHKNTDSNPMGEYGIDISEEAGEPTNAERTLREYAKPITQKVTQLANAIIKPRSI